MAVPRYLLDQSFNAPGVPHNLSMTMLVETVDVQPNLEAGVVMQKIERTASWVQRGVAWDIWDFLNGYVYRTQIEQAIFPASSPPLSRNRWLAPPVKPTLPTEYGAISHVFSANLMA
jgi:hypothetical protein